MFEVGLYIGGEHKMVLLLQLADVNWIQAGISIVSALIVGGFTFIFNKRKHFDELWWEKRIEKYEECLAIISELEHFYSEWIREIEYGVPSKDKLMSKHSKLLLDTKSKMFAGLFYFDKKSIMTLETLNSAIDNAEYEWGNSVSNSYEIILEVCKVVEKSKHDIINNAKKELRIN